MSPRAAALAGMMLVSAGACEGRRAEDTGADALRDAGTRTDTRTDAATATGAGADAAAAADAATAAVTATAAVAATATTAAAAKHNEHPIERELAAASITALTPRADEGPGVFHASVVRRGHRARAASEVARLSLAIIDDPYAYRRPLAFYRLARALGARVVPASVVRRISAGELGSLLEGQPEWLSFYRARASIQNDGTIDALLSTPGSVDLSRDARASRASPWVKPVGPRALAMNGAAELSVWAGWARSREPAPGENTPLLRDYVEMLVLDYLAANVIRKAVVLNEATSSLVLADNGTAFPLHPDPRALDPLLSRLRECARFPRGLRERLARFDRTAAAAALAPGSFETWLVSPRSLVTLDERRVGLLTLIEARIAEAELTRDAGPGTSKDEAAEERAVLSL
jgi:hypothetical protein